MKTWQQAYRDSWVSGSIASLASTAMASLCGKREVSSGYAPSNATSQWIWGERARHQYAPSIAYTATGYAIHHASAVFWAAIYEKWLGGDARIKALRSPITSGAVIAGLAYFTDYKIVPRRLRPGFEQHLTKPSLFLVYAAFGLTMGLRGYLAKKINSDTPQQMT